jgi:hypothetical protein
MEIPMYRLFIGCTALLSLLVGSVGEAAPSLPFERHGVIERLSAHDGLIVINDATYGLPGTAKVHVSLGKAKGVKERQEEPEVGHISLLRPGMHIGFRVEGEGPGQRGRIVEAWILPPGSIPKSRD